ncbi:SAYSvFN domain-containing protein 1 [Nibea albiflora]|uniref:SAYSvFN domain-containing protein 1 n=1 Tax=Nibea albiflora TaxID=240163 RepID=A0ACB7FBL5_NIBAL|nr:SAYSvFN domain-containing protein 1 [Nibea albiflora]
MEQKLAEFRARRQAAVKNDESAAPRCTARTVEDTAPLTDTTPTTDRQADRRGGGEEQGLTSEPCEKVKYQCEKWLFIDQPVSGAVPLESSSKYQSVIKLQHDGGDWLLDSALGKWLSSKQVLCSNLTLLKVLLWLVLLGLFAELEFGLPFFIISLFYWLYEGLRSPAAREPGEMSAYSVFNPDCQPLLGALTAEQLEGEMGYRPLANR